MQIETILSTPEIILHPPVKEIQKLTAQSVRDCVESTKQFVRWMSGNNISSLFYFYLILNFQKELVKNANLSSVKVLMSLS